MSRPSADSPTGPAATGLAEAQRVGLGYALRTAGSRALALEVAAAAVEQRLIGLVTTSDRMTVAKLLEAIEGIDDAERAAVLRAAGLRDGRALPIRLDAGARPRFVRALRNLAKRTASP